MHTERTENTTESKAGNVTGSGTEPAAKTRTGNDDAFDPALCERDWGKLAAITLTIALWGVGVYLLFRYAVGILLPFLLALAVSAAIRPIAVYLSEKLHLRRSFCAFFLTLSALVLTIFLLFLGCTRLLGECNRLLEWLTKESGGGADAVARIGQWFAGLGERFAFVGRLQKIPAVGTLVTRVDELLSAALTGLIGELSAKLPSLAAGIAGAAPSVFLFAITFVLACFYFAADNGEIGSFFSSILPVSVREKLGRLRPRLRKTALRYVRAYLLLMALTFSELFIGFLILGMPYAFLAALLIAFVDLLPVFGTGTVLVPWAVIRLLSGDVRMGIGLLVVYGVTLLVRQIAEPHIVGGSIGQHPLVTLFSMYVGYRLFGLTGLLLGPIAALLIRSAFFSDASRTEKGENASADDRAADGRAVSVTQEKRRCVFRRGVRDDGECRVKKEPRGHDREEPRPNG